MASFGNSDHLQSFSTSFQIDNSTPKKEENLENIDSLSPIGPKDTDLNIFTRQNSMVKTPKGSDTTSVMLMNTLSQIPSRPAHSNNRPSDLFTPKHNAFVGNSSQTGQFDAIGEAPLPKFGEIAGI